MSTEISLFDLPFVKAARIGPPEVEVITTDGRLPFSAVYFTVYGTPKPQGSMKAFTPKGWARPILTSDNAKLKPWRQEISATVIALGLAPFAKHVPVKIELDFYFERPASVSAKKRPHMTVKPDGDKLIRAVFDALTGTLLSDDAQVVECRHRKFYGLPERVEVRIGACNA